MRLTYSPSSCLVVASFAGFFSFLSVSSHAIPPSYDHVVIVMEENEDYGAVIGNPSAPYINSLASGGMLLTRMRGITHPSQPNYLGLFSGDNQGALFDGFPTGLPFSTPNLAAALLAAGKTFIGYADGLPAAGDITSDSVNGYVRYHCPWICWVKVPAPTLPNHLPPSVHQPFTAFPNDFTQLPTVAFVIPNNLHNMHDTGVAAGDTWLSQNLAAYATWAKTNNSLLIVTWDEDNFGQSNSTPTILYGANLATGKNAGSWSLHNLLRTIEDMYGLTHSGLAAKTQPVRGVFTGEPDTVTRIFTTGAVDTMISAANADAAYGSASSLVVGGGGSAPTSQSLIRFDSLTIGLIPPGAIITSAKLLLSSSSDSSIAPINLHRMLVPWSGTSTWNTLGAGVRTDGIKAVTIPEFSAVPSYPSTVVSFDVTETVKALQTGAPNYGWMLQSPSIDTWTWASAETSSFQSPRPQLEVSYLAFGAKFSVATAGVSETAGTISLNVSRIGGIGEGLTANWATSDISATAGQDYVAGSGTLTWAAGDPTSRTVTIAINADTLVEPNESFFVNLSGMSTPDSFVTVTILETPFNQWRYSTFGAGEANSPATAETADYDGDGIPNLVEYALVLDPKKPSQLPLIRLDNGSDYSERLTTVLNCQSSQTDVTIELQASSDLLGPWTTISASTRGGPFTGPAYSNDDPFSGLRTVVLRDIVGVSETPQRFLRIRVTH